MRTSFQVPEYKNQWGLHNSKTGIDIEAEKAWKLQKGSKDVIIAVIDSGIDLTHPDLKDNLWLNVKESEGKKLRDDDRNGIIDDLHGANFVDPYNPTGKVQDTLGHGTLCSGIIGAHSKDGSGLTGVNWKVSLLTIKAFNEEGVTSAASVVMAIDYAIQMKARILNAAWGDRICSISIKEAIERADAAGLLFVAQAGNQGFNNDEVNATFPATYDIPNILAVGAIDEEGFLIPESSYGKKTVDLVAPGKNILGTMLGGKWGLHTGTSAATAFASGVAGLLVAQNASLSAVELKQRLMTSTRPLNHLRQLIATSGLLNAFYALNGVSAPEDPNDVNQWPRRPWKLATSHPYGGGVNEVYEASVPGAHQIVVSLTELG